MEGGRGGGATVSDCEDNGATEQRGKRATYSSGFWLSTSSSSSTSIIHPKPWEGAARLSAEQRGTVAAVQKKKKMKRKRQQKSPPYLGAEKLRCAPIARSAHARRSPALSVDQAARV